MKKEWIEDMSCDIDYKFKALSELKQFIKAHKNVLNTIPATKVSILNQDTLFISHARNPYALLKALPVTWIEGTHGYILAMVDGYPHISIRVHTAQDPDDTALPPDDTALPPDDTALPPDDTALPPDDTSILKERRNKRLTSPYSRSSAACCPSLSSEETA